MTSAADFPDDIDALKAMLMAAEAQIGVQNKTIDERDGIIERKEDRIIRLKKPEKGHPDQYHLALEDIETAMRRMKQLIPPQDDRRDKAIQRMWRSAKTPAAH